MRLDWRVVGLMAIAMHLPVVARSLSNDFTGDYGMFASVQLMSFSEYSSPINPWYFTPGSSLREDVWQRKLCERTGFCGYQASVVWGAFPFGFEFVAQPGKTTAKSAKNQSPRRYTMLDGRDIFVRHCMSCHLAEGQTAPQLANQSDWSWRIQAGVDALVHGVIEGQVKSAATGNTEQEQSSVSMQRYRVGPVETVEKTPYDDRTRGCLVKRGGCDDCSDAEIIAVVKYMVQAAADDRANYELW